MLSFELHAKNLGVLGKTYEISEKNMLDEIKKEISNKQDKLKKEMGIAFKNYLTNPKGYFLPRAKVEKEFSIDLNFRVRNNIKDANGKILVKAGTVINPLHFKRLTKKLCFFDGTDNEQLNWVIKNCAKDIRNKLILTRGSFLKLSNKLKKRFYFDQRSILIQRFKIDSLPAIVEQKGGGIYVKQVFLP